MLEPPCVEGSTMNTAGECVDFNACTTFPCAGNATCADIRGGAADESGRQCTCSAGYGGDECEQIDACVDNACTGANIACEDLPPPAESGAAGRNW